MNPELCQKHDFRDLDLEGQGPKSNTYFRKGKNLPEIVEDISAKLWMSFVAINLPCHSGCY